MFAITRHRPLGPSSGVRDLVNWINEDPFFGVTRVPPRDAGVLPLDVSVHDGVIVVRASLPGFKREEIEVQVHEGVLTVKAEHTEETETTDEKFYRRERRSGVVSRRLALPTLVSEDEASASLEDGVLTLRFPQAKDALPKQIEIGS